MRELEDIQAIGGSSHLRGVGAFCWEVALGGAATCAGWAGDGVFMLGGGFSGGATSAGLGSTRGAGSIAGRGAHFHRGS